MVELLIAAGADTKVRALRLRTASRVPHPPMLPCVPLLPPALPRVLVASRIAFRHKIGGRLRCASVLALLLLLRGLESCR